MLLLLLLLVYMILHVIWYCVVSECISLDYSLEFTPFRYLNCDNQGPGHTWSAYRTEGTGGQLTVLTIGTHVLPDYMTSTSEGTFHVNKKLDR